MKIYLAGKIEPGDWREELVEPSLLLFGNADIAEQDNKPGPYHWPIRERAIFKRFDYIGPFLEDESEDTKGFFSYLSGSSK